MLPILFLAACTTLRADRAADPHGWTKALQAVDDRGRVDYENVDRGALAGYVAWLAAPREFASRDDELAFWINAYNACVMYQVLERWPLESVADGKVRFFVGTKFIVNGRKLSLYAMENDVVRGFGDPRIHFALNCASASCPRLPRTPFAGANLEAELERETRRFLADVAVVDDKLVLSAILDWYDEDFPPDPAAWVRARRPDLPPASGVTYRAYDWALNAR